MSKVVNPLSNGSRPHPLPRFFSVLRFSSLGRRANGSQCLRPTGSRSDPRLWLQPDPAPLTHLRIGLEHIICSSIQITCSYSVTSLTRVMYISITETSHAVKNVPAIRNHVSSWGKKKKRIAVFLCSFPDRNEQREIRGEGGENANLLQEPV